MSKTFLKGNPLHDKFNIDNPLSIDNDKRKIISVITCLHTEYEYKENPKECYLTYIRNIYKSIDFNKCLLVIKMHPNDTLNPNFYEIIRDELNLNTNQVRILNHVGESVTVYDLIIKSELIISRSSSIIEETLMLGKKVIAYDLFEDGHSKFYDFLLKYNTYRKVIGSNIDLEPVIDEFISELIDITSYIDELILNTTFALDGKSSERIINILKTL